MITYLLAISSINSTAECSISNNDLSTIKWREGTTPISTEDIQAKYDELIAIENNRATDKASGNAKLVALGLNEAEVDALTK